MPVNALLAHAAQLLSARQPAEAITPLREAALLQPSDPAIQHDLGLTCLEVGRVPEAIAAFQRAVTIKPRYADAHFRLGIALEKLGDVRSAESEAALPGALEHPTARGRCDLPRPLARIARFEPGR